MYVVITANDGYQLVLSGGEIDPNFGHEPILLTWNQDGQPLEGDLAPLRLVVPGDPRGGRYIYGIVSIDVRSIDDAAAWSSPMPDPLVVFAPGSMIPVQDALSWGFASLAPEITVQFHPPNHSGHPGPGDSARRARPTSSSPPTGSTSTSFTRPASCLSLRCWPATASSCWCGRTSPHGCRGWPISTQPGLRRLRATTGVRSARAIHRRDVRQGRAERRHGREKGHAARSSSS